MKLRDHRAGPNGEHPGIGSFEIFWDNGHALDVRVEDGQGQVIYLSWGQEEAVALREWLIRTMLGRMDAPEIQMAYDKGEQIPPDERK